MQSFTPGRKAVIITGVTGALGGELVKVYLEQGFAVYGCGSRSEKVQSLQGELKGECDIQTVDICSWEQVHSWMKSIHSKGVEVTKIIHCAGSMNKPMSVKNMLPSEFESCVRVNLLGTFHVLKAALSYWEAEPVIFVNFSSEWGREGRHHLAPYCASKFGVDGLAQSVAQEVKGAFKIITFDPGGGIRSEMLSTCLPGEEDLYPTPQEWIVRGFPFIENELGAFGSGSFVTLPASP